MLILDSTQVKYCQVSGKIENQQQTLSGLIYNNNVFIQVKSFPIAELEIAIKECREEYLDHETRSQIATLLVKETTSVGIWMADNRYQPLSNTSVVRQTPTSKSKSNADLNRVSVRQLALEMQKENGISIKARRYKLKLYQRCFLGNEVVDWLVAKLKVSRTDAVKVGQKMIDKNIFHHVTNDHPFKDEPLFYRFSEDEGKSIWTDKLV